MKRKTLTILFDPALLDEDIFKTFLWEIRTELTINISEKQLINKSFNNRIITINNFLQEKRATLYTKHDIGVPPQNFPTTRSRVIFISIDAHILNENTLRRLFRQIRNMLESTYLDKNFFLKGQIVSRLLQESWDTIYGSALSCAALEEDLKSRLWVHLNKKFPLAKHRLRPRNLGNFGLEKKEMHSRAVFLKNEYFSLLFKDKTVRDYYREVFIRRPPIRETKGSPALWSTNKNFYRFLRDYDTDDKW